MTFEADQTKRLKHLTYIPVQRLWYSTVSSKVIHEFVKQKDFVDVRKASLTYGCFRHFCAPFQFMPNMML